MPITQRFFHPAKTYSCEDLLGLLKQGGFAVDASGEKTDMIIGDIASAEDGQSDILRLIYAENEEYVSLIQQAPAAGMVLVRELPKDVGNKFWVAVDNPKYAFTYLAQIFYPKNDSPYVGVGETPIAKSAKLGKNFTSGHGIIIGENVVIGDNVRIGHNTVIADDCVIGSDCDIGSNCMIRCCVMGDEVKILSGAVIGEIGFGFAHADGKQALSIPHIGGVILGDRVMIGPNSAIDRGKLTDTILGDDVKLDNLVHIGHNVRIDSAAMVAGQVGLAGSCHIGSGVILCGQSGVSHGISVGKDSVIMGNSGVIKNLPAGSKVMGTPTQDIKDFADSLGVIKRLRRQNRKDKR